VIYFRLRDYFSVLCWRVARPWFGRMERGVRIVRPLRIVGARYCELGNNVTVQVGAYVAVLPIHADPPALLIGARTMIGNHAHIIVTRRVEFGEAVLTGDRLYVADNRHTYEDPECPVLDQGLTQLTDVSIGDGTWIGENVGIIGCRVGRNCVIGANSLVMRDVPDHCVVVGTPARIIKRYCPDRGGWYRTDPDGGFVK